MNSVANQRSHTEHTVVLWSCHRLYFWPLESAGWDWLLIKFTKAHISCLVNLLGIVSWAPTLIAAEIPGRFRHPCFLPDWESENKRVHGGIMRVLDSAMLSNSPQHHMREEGEG